MNDEPTDIKISINAVDRAQALIEMGRYEQAIPLLSQAIAADPDNDWLYCRLADIYFYTDEYEKSFDLASKALHLNPNSDYAHHRLAWNHLKLNHYDGALKHARAAIKVDPDDAANLYTLTWCEYHSGHFKKALTAAERAIELNPDDAELKELLADLTFNEGKYKQAEKYYREALRNNPESSSIHCYLGLCLAEQHKIHEAVDHLLAAVKIEPDNEMHRDKLFSIIHHEIMDLPESSRATAMKEFGPTVKAFYEDQLKREGWSGKLRLTSIVTMWLFFLTLLMALFTWLTGDDVNGLLRFAYVVAGIYFLLFVFRFIMNRIRMTKYKAYRNQK